MASSVADDPFGADPPKTLEWGRQAIAHCRRCALYRDATQAVFGEGPAQARMMLVGEQPGDQEDLAGRPFVGPAGQVLDKALAAAGIARDRVFITNAVKHFKFEARGKRRLHKKPNAGEIRACRVWLGLERQFVGPRVIVAMGATAVAAVLGQTRPLGEVRGRAMPLETGAVMWATIHPSYLLRLNGVGDVAAERQRFEADLRAAHDLAGQVS